MAKEQEKQSGPVEERIIRAGLNTTVNIPGLGPHQTIAVEPNGNIEKLQPHRLGLAVTMRSPSFSGEEFFVIPWANIALLRVKLVNPDKK